MSTTFEAPVGELLGETRRERIIVPEFQRGYEWEKKHVEAYWKDIEEIQKEQGLKGGRKHHFLGAPIVLLKRDDEEWELLDGQQRLATTTILFSVIRDVADSIRTTDGPAFARDTHANYILKGESEMALILGETDEVHFRETVQSFPSLKRQAKLRTNRNIDAAKKFLTAKVKDAIGATSTPAAQIAFLRELRRVLIRDMIVACITVEQENEAFKIFETLNDRGLRLAAPDLLFNLLMQKADKKDRKKMRGLWTEIIEALGAFELKDFLRAYWVSKHGDIKKTDLFSVLREHIEKGTTTPLQFIKECASEVAFYVNIVGVESRILKNATSPVKSLIVELSSDVPVPLLLSAIQKLTPQQFDELCRRLLVFIIRYSVMGGLDRAGIEDICYAQAREMRGSNAPEDTFTKFKETLKKNTPEDKQIDSSKIELNPTSARYVMPKIAAYVQSKSNEWNASDSVNIEHIYPKSPKPEEWGGAEGQAILDDYLWHIGNLTILAVKLNAKAANSEFNIKRPHYEKSSVEMTRNVAKDYREWSKTKILGRAQNMSNKAKEIWRYDNLSRV